MMLLKKGRDTKKKVVYEAHVFVFFPRVQAGLHYGSGLCVQLSVGEVETWLWLKKIKNHPKEAWKLVV